MSKCESCGNEIDPEICWCGDYVDKHEWRFGMDHTAVPMGCTCFFAKDCERKPEDTE